MHSLRKTLFHVVGIFFLLLTAIFWYAVMGEVKLLNELVDKVIHLQVAGYSFEAMDEAKRPVALVLAGSGPGLYLAVSLFAIGWLEGSRRAMKVFFALTGALLAFLFFVLWFLFLDSDHIVAASEKMELLVLSMFLGGGAIVFCLLGFGSGRARRQKAAEESNMLSDSYDMPSVASLLEENVSAESAQDETSSTDGEEAGATLSPAASDKTEDEEESPPPALTEVS
ncbi:MAG: hypothetical protein VB980_05105, partial [Opitutales bacterium]